MTLIHSGKILLKMMVMNKQYSHTNHCALSYNGITYNGKDDLLKLSVKLKSSFDEELRFLAVFLEEWCNDNSFIDLQTSGSTGQPKLIRVEKSAMLASAERTIRFLKLHSGDTALLCLSAKYIAGKMMVGRAMFGGLKLLQGTVNSNPLCGIEGKIDFAAMVPLQVASIVNEHSKMLMKVDKLIIGGGALDQALACQLDTMGVQAWETYGMTETVSHIALRKVSQTESPFLLLPEMEIGIDKRHCLVIQPSSVNMDQLVTNDVVELVAKDAFLLKGRIDSVVNTGGIKVFPEEVERKLKEWIKPAFVISSRPDYKLGQRLVLVIEGVDDGADNWESIFSVLQPFERPKEVHFIQSFPMTETGKVQRLKIQQLFA